MHAGYPCSGGKPTPMGGSSLGSAQGGRVRLLGRLGGSGEGGGSWGWRGAGNCVRWQGGEAKCPRGSVADVTGGFAGGIVF